MFGEKTNLGLTPCQFSNATLGYVSEHPGEAWMCVWCKSTPTLRFDLWLARPPTKQFRWYCSAPCSQTILVFNQRPTSYLFLAMTWDHPTTNYSYRLLSMPSVACFNRQMIPVETLRPNPHEQRKVRCCQCVLQPYRLNHKESVGAARIGAPLLSDPASHLGDSRS